MIRKAIVLILAGAVGLAGTAWAGTYSGGTGEPNDPYRIADANDMNDIGNHPGDWGSHFVMVNDVNLADYTGTQFNIIGNSTTKFTGVFDGNNHKIVNFTYSGTKLGPVGLFSYVDGVGGVEAEIKDLSLIDPNIDVPTGNPVGALVGELTESKIYGCCVEGGKVSGGDKAGGLVGNSGKSTIWDCYSSTNVRSDGGEAGGLVCENNRSYIFNCYTTGIVDGSDAGGLVASNDEGTISNCYSTSNVSASYRVGGGLVGYNNSMISNSYSSGNVSGNEEVGGLVGENYGTVVNCYAVGNISGTSNVGGLVGHIINGTVSRCYSAGRVEADGDAGGFVGCNEGTITDCYWDTETSEQEYGVGAGDANGVNGKTTAQMKQQATFVNWDFVDFWAIEEGVSYPYFRDYGSGTVEDPYLIRGPKLMQHIGANPYLWDKHFKLVADINLSEYTGLEFNLIGTWDNPFTGVFDGNGHTISNFTRTGYVGSGPRTPALFRFVNDPNAEIRDLTLIEPNVAIPEPILGVGSLVGELRNGMIFGCGVQGGSVSGGHIGTGGLVGWNGYGGLISNCYATCDVSEGDWASGGLVGQNEGTVLNCYATGGVSASEGWGGAGGLVGNNQGGVISNCYATGSVSGDYETGGLVSQNNSTARILNCYATGNVKGNWAYVGGLVAINGGTISNSYATGPVDGNEWIGGLSGGNWGTVTACFWDVESSSVWDGVSIGSSSGITGKITAEMKKENTFTDAGWDFVEIWNIGENQTYPFLRIYPAGDLNHDGVVDMRDFAILALHWLEGTGP